ncbi:hypothetical protein [Streptomyces sp. NPDC046925]|uniref:hypothetical protein n=1 Tax=Streptomyces sp. NPDC046925 TaxID=3155375 RepID=UPI0033C7C8D8
MGGLMMAMGYVAAGLGLWWQIALTPLLPAAAWWLGPWVADRERHSRVIVWGCGLALVGGAALTGYAGRVTVLQAGGLDAVWQGCVLLGVLLVVLRGCWCAVRQSWLSRNAVALLSLAALPMAWVLPWMGRLLQGIYITELFGVPLSAVNADAVWMYFAGVKLAGLCIGAALCGLAMAGWARHAYWITGSMAYCVLVIGVFTALMMLAAMVLGLSSANTAAQRTAAQASAGHDLSSFYGISARRVCVSPLEKDTAVQPGPLPTGHPVVAFDVSGDETWLWDPQRAQDSSVLAESTLRVRSDQIVTRAVAAHDRSCPSS